MKRTPNGASSRPPRCVVAPAIWSITARKSSSAAWSVTGPPIAEVGPAIVDESHRDAVAEVGRREGEQARIAEVETR